MEERVLDVSDAEPCPVLRGVQGHASLLEPTLEPLGTHSKALLWHGEVLERWPLLSVLSWL